MTRTYKVETDAALLARLALMDVDCVDDAFAIQNGTLTLQSLLKAHPRFLVALYVASPALYEAIRNTRCSDTLDSRVCEKVSYYILRMATRTSPFGLFCGVGLVHFGEEFALDVDEERSSLEIRPDARWLYDVDAFLASHAAADLDVVRNDRLIIRGNRFYFVVDIPDSLEVEPRSVRRTELTQFVYNIASEPVKGQKIRDAIGNKFPQLGQSATDQALASLLSCGFLTTVSLLYPDSNGPDRLMERATTVGRQDLSDSIFAVKAHLSRIRQTPISELTTESLEGLNTALQATASIVKPNDPANKQTYSRFQCNLGVRLSGHLPHDIREDVELLAEVALRCGAQLDLLTSRRLFIERYESFERRLPVLEFLSPDFGFALTEEWKYPHWDTASKLRLLSLIHRALEDRASEIVLDEEALNAVLPEIPAGSRMPEAFEVGFTIDARDSIEVAEGNYRIVVGEASASGGGGRIGARFAAVCGNEGETQKTAYGGDDRTLHAELVALPLLPSGFNVITRTLDGFRLEIGSVRSAGRVLRPDNIEVGINGNHFQLYCQSEAQPIRLHRTHMLMPSLFGPWVDGLRMLAEDRLIVPKPFEWPTDWKLPFLPRLRVKHVILRRARWYLDATLLRRADAEKQFRNWAHEFRLPKLVRVVIGDDKIPIDSSSSGIAQRIRRLAGGADADGVQIEEFPDSFFRIGKTTKRIEFVAAVTASEPRATSVTRAIGQSRTERPFRPGSEWTYAKIFCARYGVDGLLRDHIAGLIQKLRGNGVCDKWFFIRYSDIGAASHLRLRVHATAAAEKLLFEEVTSFCADLFDNHIVDDYNLASYTRELERFGGPTRLSELEQLFSYDSDIALSELRSISGIRLERMMTAASSFVPVAKVLFQANFQHYSTWTRALPSKKLVPQMRVGVKARSRVMADQLLEWDSLSADSASPSKRFAALDIADDVLHLHFNRFGVDGVDEEPDARAFLRALSISASARMPKTEEVGESEAHLR